MLWVSPNGCCVEVFKAVEGTIAKAVEGMIASCPVFKDNPVLPKQSQHVFVCFFFQVIPAKP